ncbi:MAG: hypothetical protein ABJO02_01040, partial [Reichenbachiella sp.]
MKNDLVTISLVGCLGLAVLMSCDQSQSSNVENLQPEFSNLFDLSGMPNNVKDRSVFSFSDLGAWHSYSLSPKPSGGFVGPYLMTDDNGIWASQQLVTLQLTLGGLALDWSSAKMIESLYLPGRLIQTYQLEGITIKQELIFISNRSTLVQYQIESNAKQPKVVADLKAATWLSGWSFSVDNDQLLLQSDSSKTKVLLTFDQPTDGVIEANSFVGQEQEFDLNPNFPVKISYVQSTYFTESERRGDKEAIDKALDNPVWAFANNQKRWNDYLTKTLEKTDGQA